MSDTVKISVTASASSSSRFGWTEIADTGCTWEEWGGMTEDEREKVINEVSLEMLWNDVSVGAFVIDKEN